ncbi:DNA cytosine methyltransferase [Guptibacillus sedimenti]|uniref:DNA cytosine methyltransferase n=1 Tax=Guptibacillus sedimenti TaxID=3025680 RepID=UPI00235EBF4B|nr:DNA cytosine methyltransferase [Pseudalkalibacillus sedimenti]
MEKLRVMDLFAGAGGLSNGFEQTGQFKIQIAVELDENAKKTYKTNHGSDVEMVSDITELHYRDNNNKLKKKFRNIDVIIGGPPCQGFSNANRQKNTLISNNNQLVKNYLRAIEEVSPRALVMENVSSMGSKKHKFYYCEDDVLELENLGIIPETENVKIGDKTFLSEELITLIVTSANKKESLAPFLLDKNVFSKLNTVLKKSLKSDDLINYFKNNRNSYYFQKLLLIWDSLVSACWSKTYEEEWRLVHYYISEIIFNKCNVYTKQLYKSLKVIIETQKVMNKVQEVYDNRILYEKLLFINGDSLAIRLKTFSVLNYITKKLDFLGYKINDDKYIFNAARYGVPQNRKRLILIGVRKDIIKDKELALPIPLFNKEEDYFTIYDAIGDLEDVPPEIEVVRSEKLKTSFPINSSKLNQYLNGKELILYNHVRTHTRDMALKRFKTLSQGQNFHDLDDSLKTTYTDHARTQNTVYKRLAYELPSDTVVNVRKSMWIHPIKDRALSIREAARLQSFRDNYIFKGNKDSQYQQVGNAVPPLLARVIAESILKSLGEEVSNTVNELLGNNSNELDGEKITNTFSI